MSIEKRFCKICKEEIHGRRDKQYCSDYCRANHFYAYNAKLSTFMRRVNYTIRKNRVILSQVNTKGKTRVHKSRLIDQGLNFDYFTNVYRTKSGKLYYFCYDQGYHQRNDEYFDLVIRDKYET